jgi:signal transduction histidine kinase
MEYIERFAAQSNRDSASAHQVLVDLVRLTAQTDSSDLALRERTLLEKLTETATQGVKVQRASVWLLNATRDELTLLDLHAVGKPHHESGTRLLQSDHPAYFAALNQRIILPIHDALNDPVTASFASHYLTPMGIGAMLDAPIWRSGELVGVLCLEHVGSLRHWSEAETTLATQCALYCGLYLERQERLAAENALRFAEAAERHDQKMEALGRMACAIAHDFNNLLGSMVGQAEMIAFSPHDPERSTARARNILDAGSRAGQLVGRLLAFGKGQESELIALDLTRAVRSLQPLLRSMLQGGIDLDLLLPESALYAQADPVGFEQVLINLVVNARDELNGLGTISIFLRRGRDDHGVEHVSLEVSDTGCGMDETTLARIFEPFFTTKGSHGTGLGLSTCFTSMRRMRGRIAVRSSPGHGTSFTCLFQPR